MNRFLLAAYAGFLALLWTAFLTAEIGVFRAPVCVAAGLAAAACVAVTGRRAGGDGVQTRGIEAFLLIAIMAAGLCLTWPPSELVLGGWDPGVYVHTAAAVERGGSLRIDEPDLAAVPDAAREVLFRDLHGIREPFGGMRLLPDGRVSPSFHHLYPCLLAVAWSFAGVWGALAVNQMLYAAAIAAMYAFARRLTGGGWWALLAALFLALNPAQVWQAGFPTAELLAQFLFLGGLASFAAMADSREARPLYASVAGASFGLALLARYDAVIFLAPAAALLLARWPQHASRRNVAVVLAATAALVVHGRLHERFIAPYYEPVPNLVRLAVFAALGAGVVAGVVMAAIRRLGWAEKLRKRAPCWRSLAATIFAAWAVFAWAVRPGLAKDEGLLARKAGDFLARFAPESVSAFLAGPEASNMLYLTWICGPAGLAVALGGILWLLLRPRTAWQACWLYPAAGALIVLVTCIFNDHFLMWVSRRFVPVVIPFLATGMVAGVMAAWRLAAHRSRRLAAVVAAAVALACVAGMVPQLRYLKEARDWPGLVEWFDGVQALIPEGSVVYSDQPGFAATLRFMHGKRAFELQARHKNKRLWLARLMQHHAKAGADVLFLTCEGPIDGAGVAFDLVAARPLKSHTQSYQRVGFPRGVRERGCEIALFRVLPAGGTPAAEAP